MPSVHQFFKSLRSSTDSDENIKIPDENTQDGEEEEVQQQE
jgi:hypothetical protein